MGKGNLEKFPDKNDVLLTAADVAKAMALTEAQLLDLVKREEFPTPDVPAPGNPQWHFSTCIKYLDEWGLKTEL